MCMCVPGHCSFQSQTLKVWVLIQRGIHSPLHLGHWTSLEPFSGEEAAKIENTSMQMEKYS